MVLMILPAIVVLHSTILKFIPHWVRPLGSREFIPRNKSILIPILPLPKLLRHLILPHILEVHTHLIPANLTILVGIEFVEQIRFRHSLANPNNLHVEMQRRTTRDIITGTVLPVPQLRRNDQSSLGTQAQSHDALVPSRNDLSRADGDAEGLAAIARTIEFEALHAGRGGLIDGAGVVHGEGVALFDELFSLAFGGSFVDFYLEARG
mmetsp:Transcript_13277/g.24052  ORF Transcript_13277/g.24052 Transcript_13277/m.24052 type:complete len:208 (+) Transcript_13277:251-874(+)